VRRCSAHDGVDPGGVGGAGVEPGAGGPLQGGDVTVVAPPIGGVLLVEVGDGVRALAGADGDGSSTEVPSARFLVALGGLAPKVLKMLVSAARNVRGTDRY
jgi:hypothetical protein